MISLMFFKSTSSPLPRRHFSLGERHHAKRVMVEKLPVILQAFKRRKYLPEVKRLFAPHDIDDSCRRKLFHPKLRRRDVAQSIQRRPVFFLEQKRWQSASWLIVRKIHCHRTV